MNAPDWIVTGARPWSAGAPLAGRDAIAVRGGRIVALGSSRELLAQRGGRTTVLDAHGATVTPGLCDAHIHLLAWARGRRDADLFGARSPDEVAERVAAFLAAHPGRTPAVGRGWDANGWTRAPHRAALDRVAPERPLLLFSHDYHNAWLNSAALQALGIDRKTQPPAGGFVIADPAGEPTGVLAEHAMRLAAPLERARAAEDFVMVADAARALHAFGITAVHDFEGAEAHRLLRRLAAGEGPRLRVLMHLPHGQLEQAIELGWGSGLGDAWFRIGAVKLFADGTLGSRTAAVLAPYEDAGANGCDLIPPAELKETVARAVGNGWAVAVHAIGDRAVRATLDAFAAAGPSLARLPQPARVEHLQLVDPSDLPRFAALGVAASMQPIHCVADIPAGERAWGKRRDRTYPWRSLLDTGAMLLFGSDAPVETPDVAFGLHAALARRTPGGPAWAPEQSITLDEALAAYTETPASAAGSWPETGSLAPGAAADLVVWNADLHALAIDELRMARPVLTMLAGEVVYEAADVPSAAEGCA